MEHHEGTFIARDGMELYQQRWLPEGGEPRASLVVVHGLGEHSGRYDEFAAWFVDKGYAVHAFDHRGHGRSPGARGHVGEWAEYRGEVAAFLKEVRDRGAGEPTFLVGHSLGALIALDYGLHDPQGLRGIAVSAPPLDWGEDVARWRIALAKVLAGVLPRLQMDNGLNAQDLSHDPKVAPAYTKDPLVHGWITPKFGAELDRAMQATREGAPRWPADLPLLILHGGDDPIAPPEASEAFYARAGAEDKTRYEYPNLLHEIFNERERGDVLKDVATWLEAHLSVE